MTRSPGRIPLVNLGDGFAGRVFDTGTGGPGVFWIHAYSLNSACWRHLWNHLPDWRHIGVDLPGHGSSLPLKVDEELSALAKRIGALAIRRDARHLIASSF